LTPESQIAIRLGAAAGLFALLALWEWRAPHRRREAGRGGRWFGNLGLLAVDMIAVRLIAPTAAVGAALLAAHNGWGLLPLLHVPYWPAVLVSIVALDLVIYAQHMAFHHVPVLWRLHRVHHADTELDVTTGLRFHPFEILLSLAIKVAAVLALGAPALAVVAFEVLLNATAMFNHSNVALPPRLEPLARWLVVTPQMHEVHHSADRRETDSNFGFNLPWWDRLFGTYRAAPAAGDDGVVIGLPDFREPAERTLLRLLTQPFRRGAASMQAAEGPDQQQDRNRHAEQPEQ
jgi:sterol desaturase/sphingolipid hydroxylase (fatty acid hydroxylase superfamily)